MKLIGMLDSPYVRRVAITLQRLDLRFEHLPLSVFRDFEAFGRINPVVKAPTLVCDDGLVLMDSGLIIDHAERLAEPGRRLVPSDADEHRRVLRILGLALAACEKSVQIVYEGRRPPQARHEPWVMRVRSQMLAALDGLEEAVQAHPLPAGSRAIGPDGIATAVTWRFITQELPGEVDTAAHPRLAAWSAYAEALPEFRAAPHGNGTVLPLPADESASEHRP